MKLPSLTPLLLAILLPAPIKAFASEINHAAFSGKISSAACRLGIEAVNLVVTPLQPENGTALCGRVVTGFHAGSSRPVLAPKTYESGAGLALVGRW